MANAVVMLLAAFSWVVSAALALVVVAEARERAVAPVRVQLPHHQQAH